MDRHRPILDILLGLDRTPSFRLEQLRARRTRGNVLRELAFKGH